MVEVPNRGGALNRVAEEVSPHPAWGGQKRPLDWDVWGLTQAVKWQEVGHKGCRGRVAKEADCTKARGKEEQAELGQLWVDWPG